MMYVSLGDLVPPLCHAHFVHGAAAAEEHHYKRLVRVVADHYHTGTVNVVVINGLSVDECKRQSHGYCGFEIYQDILTDFGIPEECIALLPSSPHTAAESRNLLDMARVQGWQHLVVSSLPHHQLRCFLQIVAILERPYWFKVYNMTTGGQAVHSVVAANHDHGRDLRRLDHRDCIVGPGVDYLVAAGRQPITRLVRVGCELDVDLDPSPAEETSGLRSEQRRVRNSLKTVCALASTGTSDKIATTAAVTAILQNEAVIQSSHYLGIIMRRFSLLRESDRIDQRTVCGFGGRGSHKAGEKQSPAVVNTGILDGRFFGGQDGAPKQTKNDGRKSDGRHLEGEWRGADGTG